jgi:hypothetical protein
MDVSIEFLAHFLISEELVACKSWIHTSLKPTVETVRGSGRFFILCHYIICTNPLFETVWKGFWRGFWSMAHTVANWQTNTNFSALSVEFCGLDFGRLPIISYVIVHCFLPSLIKCALGCPTKNIKYDFRWGSARLQNFKLLRNCRKKNQPDWIRF